MATDDEAQAAQTKTRIFVGGLGETVTSDDLQKIFTQKSLGKVDHLDFVRTKGRSFAYVDFCPSDDHSLPKLFSTYNGCVWKGGRLRLEKAKEHYLARLKREWTEDAENANSNLVDSDEKNTPLVYNKKEAEKMQLHIYFPRLRKIKSIPFNGSGKHKYSFQRVDVPALPVNFCDCEEHSIPAPCKRNSAPVHNNGIIRICDAEGAQEGGMNEDEVNIMTSVMNKLMQGGSNSNAKNGETELTKAGAESTKPANDIQSNDSFVESEGEEDNLILNITKREDSIATRPISTKKRSRLDRTKSPKDGLQQDSRRVKRSNISTQSNSKSFHSKGERDEVASDSTGGKETLQTKSTASMPLAIGTDMTKHDLGMQKSTSSISWYQKSSWKELVGNKSSGTFSVSQILAESTFSKEQRQPDGSSEANPTDRKIDQGHLSYGNLNGKQSGKMKEPIGQQQQQPEAPSESNPTARKMDQDQLRYENLGGKQSDKKKESIRQQQRQPDGPSDSNPTQRKMDEDQVSYENLNGKQSDNKRESDVFVDLQNKEADELVKLQTEESDGPAELQCEKPAAASVKSGRGASWCHKSSWTQLVSENNGLFSISQILPGTNFEKKMPECQSTDVAKSAFDENCDFVKQGKSSEIQHNAKNVAELKERSPKVSCQSLLGIQNKEYSSAASDVRTSHVAVADDGKNLSPPMPARTKVVPSKKPALGSAGIGETCSFMRSAASLKEWQNSKAALSGSFKKKNKEKEIKE